MNVSLTTEFEQFVDDRVKSGDYTSASEVVRAGLRLLKEREAEHQARLEALRSDVRHGVQQLVRGEGSPGHEVFEQLRNKRESRRRRKRA